MKKNTIILIIVIIAGGALLFYGGYKLAQKQIAIQRLEDQKKFTQKETDLSETITSLADQVDSLNEIIKKNKERNYPDDKVSTVFNGTLNQEIILNQQGFDCLENEKQLLALVQYIDSKKYAEEYQIEDGAFGLFVSSLIRLTKNRPKVADERDGALSFIRNISYLYRILGKKRLLCFRKIMTEEPEIIETTFILFYKWMKYGESCDNSFMTPPTFSIMYDYACYFLSTIGGQSYLIRRDSTTRILMTYYSTLIVHQANLTQQNRYGLDIKPFVKKLKEEITQFHALAFRDIYSANLAKIPE
jgi:hypothetical protein